MPELTNVIYGLFDVAEPSRIRYVGLTTKTATERLRTHWNGAHATMHNRPVFYWLRKRERAEVGVRVLESGDDREHLLTLERFWIAQMRSLAQADLNLADGGESTLGYRHTVENRQRMSQRNRDNPTMLGRKHTPETRAKMRAAAAARVRTPESGEAQSQRAKLFWATPGIKLAMSKARSSLTEGDVRQIRRLRDVDGLRYQQIVDALPDLPLHAKYVGAICRRECWSALPPERMPRIGWSSPRVTFSEEGRAKVSAANTGSRHHKALLTETQVGRIKSSLAAGARGIDLAAEYGVTKSVIGHIKLGRTWTHVPWPESLAA